MALAEGTKFGPYEVGRLIGVGGMGEVYRATDTKLRREVALKVLPASFATEPDRVARFEREARTLAALNHANIAQIYGLERQGETTALVMELVEGPTLAEHLARGALTPNGALDIADQIASALEAAHERGIVHRDLKPANVKLTGDGTAKLLDFGIAKALEARSTTGSAETMAGAPTESGMVLGTLPYMSPEQARGNVVDKRTDIWAFGCVLYEMLTGRAAFLGEDTPSTLALVLERNPDMSALPTAIPANVRRTLEACLEKSFKERPRDIGDVRLALKGRFAEPAARPSLYRRALPAAVALAVGAAATAGYVTALGPSSSAVAPAVTRFFVTPPAVAPLSNLGGHDFAISPDGRRLAYLAQNLERNGVSLYVQDFAQLEPQPIVGTEVLDPTPNVNPFFSPDGRSIGFALPDGSVMRASIDGAPPQKLFDAPTFTGAAWVDDDEVIYSTGTRLERVLLNGTRSITALAQAAPNVVFNSPSLIDGTRAMLFMAVEAGIRRVVALDIDTLEQKVLIEGAQKPMYAPTGHIVFARESTLMAVAFDPENLVVSGSPVALVTGVRRQSNNGAPDYTFSASGTLAYVPASNSVSARRGRLVWVDRAGTVVGSAVDELIDYPHDPRLSHDGTRLALTSGVFAEGRISIHDLRGRPPLPLPETNSGNAVWSSDDREIAFPRFGLPGWPIYASPADGSTLVPRALGSAAGVPQQWSSAHGMLLVENTDIRVAPAAGELRDVVATDYNEFDAALSPDGEWLAYVSDRTGRPEVWAQPYPNGAPVRVSRNGGYEPRWAADGSELFFQQDGGTMHAVAVQKDTELSFGAPVQLFGGPYLFEPRPDIRSYDVAGDGRFLMVLPESTSNADGPPASIVVVQNWFEELAQRVPAQ